MPIAVIWAVLSKLPWKYIGIFLAAFSLTLLVWRAPWAEHRQKAKDAVALSAEHARAEGFRANQDKLTAALNHQNTAVAALKAEGEQRKADGKKQLSEAVRANRSLSEQATALRRSAGRKVDATPCPISETLKQAGSV
jgi:lipopolysaccharide export LptBFGC system permease protein LptF